MSSKEICLMTRIIVFTLNGAMAFDDIFMSHHQITISAEIAEPAEK